MFFTKKKHFPTIFVSREGEKENHMVTALTYHKAEENKRKLLLIYFIMFLFSFSLKLRRQIECEMPEKKNCKVRETNKSQVLNIFTRIHREMFPCTYNDGK